MLIKYILEKTPQSLNVLSSNLQSAEIHIEFEVIDLSRAKIHYLIKSPNRLIIDSLDVEVGADFGLCLISKIQYLAEMYQISIGKAFFSEESIFASLDCLTEDQLNQIGWNGRVIFYLIRNKTTALGFSVLQAIIKGHINGVITQLDMSFDFGFMKDMSPHEKTQKIFKNLGDNIPIDIKNLICRHYLLCYKVSLLRDEIFNSRFSVKVGVTETKLDLIEKKSSLIVDLSCLQEIIYKYARDKVELREKQSNRSVEYKLMMDRECFYNLVRTQGKNNKIIDVADRKVVYAKFLGKKVFYLVDGLFYKKLCSEFRLSFHELDGDTFEWLMSNLVGELCQQSAQRAIYHSITVYDHPTDLSVLKSKAMDWFRSRGYKGRKLSIGHIAMYINQNKNYDLCGV